MTVAHSMRQVVLCSAMTAMMVANAQQSDCHPKEATLPVSVGDLARQVVTLRERLAADPDNELARNTLASVTIAAARAVELLETTGNFEMTPPYFELMREQLVDTRWRTGFLAKNGDVGAQLAMAMMHRQGVLMEKDDVAACDFYRQASENGNVLATFRHAVCLSDDEPEGAVALIRQSAEQGNIAAQLTYGMICEQQAGESADCTRHWLCAATSGGRARAAGMAGWLYLTGRGAPQDSELAVTLLTFAAEHNEPPAQNQLAKILETGTVGTPDPVAAAQWYQRSAENGFAPGQYEYGRILAEGIGVTANQTMARYWMQKAAEQGLDDATDWLEQHP